MENPIELRANKIQSEMEKVFVTIPPEVRQLIDEVFSGKSFGDSGFYDQRVLIETIRSLTTLFEECQFEDLGDTTMMISLSWWTVVNRQAKAIAMLAEAGLDSETIPNIRVAFEYAMALVTLSQEEPGEMVIALIAQMIKDLSRLDAHSPHQNWEYRQAVNLAKSELDSIVVERWITGFTRRADDLRVDGRANYYYGIFSLFVHPTILGTMGFADLGQQTSMAKEPNLILRALIGNPLPWAVQCLCWSALAIDHVVEGGLSWKGELAEVIEQFQIPYADTLYSTSS